jgi:hypothetical protein
MLGVTKILVMAKDIGDLRLIIISEAFFQLISCDIVL